jgi:hypothetical protein
MLIWQENENSLIFLTIGFWVAPHNNREEPPLILLPKKDFPSNVASMMREEPPSNITSCQVVATSKITS